MNETLKKLSEETKEKFGEFLLSKEWQDFVSKTKEATETGSFEVVISTADIDRAGEVIDQNGWELDNYLKNPVVLWGHDYWSLPIGITDEIKVENGNLIARGRFAPAEANPFAQQVRKLYDLKIVRTTSVGFIAREMDGQLIKRAELLEFSFVPVPANPYALSLREIKEFSLDTDMLAIKGIVIKEKAEGDACTTDDGKEGTMKPDADGNLVCIATEAAAKAEGDTCTLEDGTEGVMKPDADGNLVCVPKVEETSEGKAEGDPCTTDDGKEGTMNAEGVCVPKPEEASAKGAISQEVEQREANEKKWARLDKVFDIVDAFIGTYLDEKTAEDAFDGLLAETVTLLNAMLPEGAKADTKQVIEALGKKMGKKFVIRSKDAEQIGAALTAMQSIIDNAIVEASKQILELYGSEETNKAIKFEKPAAVKKEGGAGEEHLGGDALKERSNDAGVKEVIGEFETFLMTRQLLRAVVTAATDSLERMNEIAREKRIGSR